MITRRRVALRMLIRQAFLHLLRVDDHAFVPGQSFEDLRSTFPVVARSNGDLPGSFFMICDPYEPIALVVPVDRGSGTENSGFVAYLQLLLGRQEVDGTAHLRKQKLIRVVDNDLTLIVARARSPIGIIFQTLP